MPEGGSNSYTLVLSSRPTGDVAIGVTLPAGTDLTLDKTSLTFTVDDWDDAQTVTVTAAEDDDGVTDAVATLTHTISGGGYASTTVPDVEVSITENDTANIVLSEPGLTLTEGDAVGSSYTVKLATKPSGTVSVSISTGSFDSSERLSVNQIDTEDFLYDSVDYQLIDIRVIQNGHHGGDDVNVKLPFGIPERTKWSMDFRNLNSGTGSEQFEILTEDWRDWTLHVSTVSGGDTLTSALRFSEVRYTGQAWWWWFGRNIDHLRRVWRPGQLYKVRLVEDPRSERTPQPLNPPMYLRVQGVVNTTQVHLRWLGPQMRDDQLAPVDRYKIQWKEASGSWGMAADVSETITGPTNGLESHFLDALTAGFEYNIRVIATDSVGDSEPSNEITYTMPADAYFSVSNTPAGGEPRIGGTPETGQTLSADTTGITDDDGLNDVVFHYQWLADDSEIVRGHRLDLHPDLRRRGQGHHGQGGLHRRCE